MTSPVQTEVKTALGALVDQRYSGLPWKDGGRDRAGFDCVGLAALWLREQRGVKIETPRSEPGAAQGVLRDLKMPAELVRGHVVFFEHRKNKEICHVAVYLGDGKLLHILQGLTSRIDNGFELLRRCKLEPVAAVPWHETERLCVALADPKLGEAQAIIMLVISLALSAASALIKPKAPRIRNAGGRYGFDALVTQQSSELPLPDLLGKVAVAGNSPYQTPLDKGNGAITTPADQAINKVVVVASGPIDEVDTTMSMIHINGLQYNNIAFHPTNGFKINPAQTKAEAVTGTIGAATLRPSISIYNGGLDIDVPIDIRASYDRDFPLYGFNGAAYLVFRLFDGSVWPSLNLVATVAGRKCREFDSTGFTVTTVASESLAGADGSKVRFKLAATDVKEVTALTVNGVAQNQVTPANNTAGSNLYHLNKRKGFIEFIGAPAAAATILCSYKKYERSWTMNPARILVYLLTEPVRGKGFDESKVDFVSFDTLKTYCNDAVSVNNSAGVVVYKRYQTNYAIDARKPFQEHLAAVLDSCYSILFISEGKFKVKARKAESSVFSFNESNIVAGTFKSDQIARANRANRVSLFYHSEGTFNAETKAGADDPVDQDAQFLLGNDGIVEETLKFFGVTQQHQAERIAEMIVREEVNAKWMVELTTNVQGLALEPGDVVGVTHSSRPTWSDKQFRIELISHDEQDRLVIQGTEYFAGAYF